MGDTMNTDPYANSAKKYDIFIERFATSLRQIGMQVYPPREGMLVLDVGCGTGTNLNLYHKAGCKVFGIDASPAMLEEAKNKLGNQAELRLGSASEMCYPDESFDLVIGMLTLHEMCRDIRLQVMNEMVRVLKREGRILLIDYHPGSIRFPKGWIYKALIYFIEIAAGREHFRNFRDFLANNGMPGLIKSLKLTIKKTEIIGEGNLGAYLLCSE
ncbi:class I SAM-dependent methyltransferase [Pontiella sulfatireligans]|uniref:Putative methyltransferase YcgJ n=1 Tax=Pontiella sulfatireligans TaxID=2750658 RepID=A0A6C2UKU5_9BACT|nr:class I SAM-dependent methyltransferase [Pontiella sulfatireligans]VGO20589.1 putative methyltransferase YcgJ [Pontiella sulfatireligans]